MAEALVVVGLVSAIVQFVDFASKVSGRLNDLRENAGQVPKALQDVRNRIPLMVDLMKTIRARVDNNDISGDSQRTMLPLIESCLAHVNMLDEMLIRASSRTNDSTFMRGKRALYGVLHESELERIDSALRANFDLLVQAATLHAISGTDVRSSSVSSQSTFHFTISPPSYTSLDFQKRPSNSSAYEVQKSASPAFMVPFPRDKNFLGRHQVIADIELRFRSQRQVALAGLGGVGKSQIAIEYCYVFHEKDPDVHVFWTYAGSRARFEQGYQEIARRLALPGWDDHRVDTMQLVYSWLCSEDSGNWLLIVDNADDASMFYGDRSADRGRDAEDSKGLAHYLPQCGKGSILVTTRDKRVGERLTGRQKPVEISPMSPQDAKDLLLTKIGDDSCDDIDAQKLIEELAHLPLAITQAAAFISENMLTISEYLELLAMGDLEIQDLLSEHLEDPRRDLDTENSVIRTWKLSFDQLLRGKPRAAQMLSLMAVLDYHAMPRTLLRDDGETEIGFRTALGALQAFSLVTPGKAPGSAYKMHRLVAISTQKWLELQGTLSYWQQQALKKLTDAYPGRQSYEYENWALLESLTPHAQIVFSFTFSTAIDMLQCSKLLDFSALYDLGKGRYREAHEKATRSIEIRTSLLPDDHQLTLDSVQTLGETQLHLGQFLAAKSTLQRAVNGRESRLGKLSPDTLESISDLAITLLELDDIESAQEMALRALEGRREALGYEHPDTITSLNILSIVQQRQGNFESANETCQKVLDFRRKTLGEAHPETLMTFNNMAVLRYRQGQLTVAEKMLKQVLIHEKALFGKDCYDRQVSLTTLAFVSAAQGSLDQAEELHREVLAIRQKVHGPNHPATRYSAENVAAIVNLKSENQGSAQVTTNTAMTVPEALQSPSSSPGALLTSGLLFD